MKIELKILNKNCYPEYATPGSAGVDLKAADDLPEDTELPASVLLALEIFNAALKDAGIVSWMPGKYAAIIENQTE